MATFTPLASPSELHEQFERIVNDWCRPMERRLHRGDTYANKHRVIAPTSYTEYVLTTDFALYVQDNKKQSDEPEEMLIPACAELTLYVPVAKWDPAKDFEVTMATVADKKTRNQRVIRVPAADRRVFGVFEYPLGDGFKQIVTIYRNGTIETKKRSTPAA